jgi:hypothetical protein
MISSSPPFFSVAPYPATNSSRFPSVERLGLFLALAFAAAYCVALYTRAGNAPGRDWLAWFPVSLALSAAAACLGVATAAVVITHLGYRPPHNLIAPTPLAAKMIIATNHWAAREELLTRALLFRAVSGSQAKPRRAIIGVLDSLGVQSVDFDKDCKNEGFRKRLRVRLNSSGVTLDNSSGDCPPVLQHTVYHVFRLIFR